MSTDADDADIRAQWWLDPGGIGALRDGCDRDGRPAARSRRDDALVTLLYDAALWAEELVALDVTNLRERSVFLPAGVQVARPTNPSPSAERIVLFDETIRTLNGYLAGRETDADALFVGESGRMTVEEVERALVAAAEAAGVRPHGPDGSRGEPSDVTPETIRDSTAWRMLYAEQGNSLYDVQNRLRHDSVETTRRVCEGLDAP